MVVFIVGVLSVDSRFGGRCCGSSGLIYRSVVSSCPGLADSGLGSPAMACIDFASFPFAVCVGCWLVSLRVVMVFYNLSGVGGGGHGCAVLVWVFEGFFFFFGFFWGFLGRAARGCFLTYRRYSSLGAVSVFSSTFFANVPLPVFGVLYLASSVWGRTGPHQLLAW